MTTTEMPPGEEPVPGNEIGGRYRLLGPLDADGKGRVLRAHDLTTGREVAIKLLGPSSTLLAETGAGVATKLTGLSHPNVAEVYDSAMSDESPYLVMELVPGQSLSDALKARGPLAPLEAVQIALQLAEALGALHMLGIVHCDVKPSNVVVTQEGTAKLVDFGVARSVGRDELDRVLGSAPYVAPERLTGRQLDGRADIYSLGATLYEMQTRRPPHLGFDLQDTLRKAVCEDAIPPTQISPGIPADLSAVTMKALARDPSRRYPTALDMARALRDVGSRLAADSSADTTSFARLEHTVSLPVLSRQNLTPGKRWAGGFGALLVVGLTLVWLGRGTGALADPSSTPSPLPTAIAIAVLPQPTSTPPALLAPATASPPAFLAATPPAVRPTPTPDPAPPTRVPVPAPSGALSATSRQVVSNNPGPHASGGAPAPKTSQTGKQRQTTISNSAGKGSAPKALSKGKPGKGNGSKRHGKN